MHISRNIPELARNVSHGFRTTVPLREHRSTIGVDVAGFESFAVL